MIKDWIEKQKAKGKLLQAFKSGELYLKYKSGKNEHLIFPKVHHINIDKDSKVLTFVFSIPTGLDPALIQKKFWIFEQCFGQNLKIKQDNKRYILKIFGSSFPNKFSWNYEKFLPSLNEYKLPIVCGIDRYGKLIVIDLVENPHLLIAGFTGSGKSTQLRSILTTFIKHFSEDELHLYLIDMKAVELTLFRNVKHVQGDIVTKGKKVKLLLKKIYKEMDRRQDLMEKEGVTHLTQLKQKQPYIIVGIDELASLPNDREIDELLVEISNRGRALCVFLIVSILRPDSVNMDSRLKGNLTVTMGFKARDRINASVIGMKGAEKLEGNGRFLMSLPSEDELVELQAPYLTEKQLEKLLEGYRVERGIEPNEDETEDSCISNNTHNGIENNEDKKEIKLGLLGGGNIEK